MSPFDPSTRAAGGFNFVGGSRMSLVCPMTIVCGEAQTVKGLLELFEGGTSSIRIVDAYKDATLLARDTSRNLDIWANNTLQLTLSVTETNTNARFSYVCLTNQFSAVGCPRGASSVITTFPTLIGSDVDGDQNKVKVSPTWWSDCVYDLQCPPGQILRVESYRQDLNDRSWVALQVADPTSPTGGFVNYGIERGSYQLQNGPIYHGNSLRMFLRVVDNNGNGFIMNYTCVPPEPAVAVVGGYSCSISKGPPRNFTTFPGRIGSDLDGVGLFGYADTADCVFNILCPDAHVVFVERFQSDVADRTIINFYDLLPSITRGQAMASLTSNRLLQNQPLSQRVQVEFLPRERENNGFDLFYTCRRLNVSVGCPTSFSRTLGPQDRFTIGSDIDGFGDIRYDNSVQCSWTLRCALPSDVLFVDRVSIDLANGDFVAVWNRDTTTAPRQGSTYRRSPGGPLDNQITFGFTADSQYTNPGFEFEISCRPGNVVMGCPANVTMTRVPMMLGTDIDGDGDFTYSNNMRCRWNLLACGEGEVLQLTNLRMAFAGGDSLQFFDTASGRRSADSDTGNLVLPGPLLVSQHVTAVFESDSQYVDRGFSFNATCVQMTGLQYFGCPFNQTLVAANGTIGSDIDGVGSFPYPSNADCRWSIRCPSPTQVVAVTTLEYRLSGGDSMEYLSVPIGAGPNRLGSIASTSENTGRKNSGANVPWLLMNEVHFRFSTNNQYVGAGWTLQFQCVTATSFVGCPVDQMITSFPGYIGSDLDGSGSDVEVANNAKCRWNITCPVGHSVTLRLLRAEILNTDKLLMYTSDLSTGGSAGRPVGIHSSGLTTSSVAAVARSVAFELETDGNYMSKGFDANYTCTPGYALLGCPVDGQVREFPGTIGSDIDGAGPFRYASPLACRWVIDPCPVGMTLAITTFTIRTQWNDPVRLSSVSNPGATFFSQTNINMAASNGPRPVGRSLVVQLSSTNANANDGFQLQYTCLKLEAQYRLGCPAGSTETLVADRGIVGTDLDGDGGTFTIAGAISCHWRAQCADPYSVVVVNRFAANLQGDDRFRFFTIDEDPRTVAANRSIAVTESFAKVGSFSVLPGQALSRAFAMELTTSSGSRNGVTLDYTCRRRWEYFGCPLNGTLRFFPGTVGSDVDGVGESPISGQQPCTFALVCPVGGVVKITYIALATPAGGTGSTLSFHAEHPDFPSGGTGTAVAPLLAPYNGPTTLTINAIPNALNRSSTLQTMYVRFVGRASWNANGGFTVMFDCDCGGTRCPLPVIPGTETSTAENTPSRSKTPEDAAKRTHTESTTLTLLPPPTPEPATGAPTTAAPPQTTAAPPTSAPPATRTVSKTVDASIAPSSPPLTTTIAPAAAAETPAPTTIAPTPQPTTAEPPPLPRVTDPPREVAAVAATTQAATVAAGMVNPAVAAQTARSSVVLSLQQCAYDLDQPLDWSVSPTGLSFIKDDVTHRFIGATLANTALVLGVLVVHYIVGLIMVKQNKSDSTELLLETRRRRAMAKVRFPGGSFMILTMFFVQPTIASAMTVSRHASTIGGQVIGIGYMIGVLATLAGGALWMRRHFYATWRDQSGEMMHRSNFKAFMEGTGKWVDDTEGHLEREGFVKMFGAFFNDFGEGCAFFGIVEIAMCILCGVLEGWRTDVDLECKGLIGTLIAVNAIYVLLLIYHRPHGTSYDFCAFLIIGSLQLLSAVASVLSVIPQNEFIAEQCAVASMLIATVKGVIDLVREAIRFKRRREQKKLRDLQSGGGDQRHDSPRSQPLLSAPSHPNDDNDDDYNVEALSGSDDVEMEEVVGYENPLAQGIAETMSDEDV